MKRSEILRLPPGPELDEIACRAVGIDGPRAGDYLDDGSKVLHDSSPPVSTDPAAAHQLAMAALDVGLGWPVVWRADGWYSIIRDPQSGDTVKLYPEGCTVLLESDQSTPATGRDPMHAAALAVALTQAENQGD